MANINNAKNDRSEELLKKKKGHSSPGMIKGNIDRMMIYCNCLYIVGK